ncbi:hypothetical protein BLJ79_17830 [Arthrobacter sp. UCD-GKA]|uniref:hypothetical protein n=1 Tax=Arthrobacter sp. UCD-GKA TaxID=1913576 RepID=UPI0008DCF068|nr:hypothetical protein [Arthrobacter sp. UCD-GKA]OIH82810.1 hypothetical protein BLJ79_17830 [Arthrobacter sp. UCD-GKA]
MARERKSAAALAAREKARTKALEMTQRHELLLEKAAEYFVLEDQSAARMASAQEQARQILDQAKQALEADHIERGRIVVAMLSTGESRALVAQRLGVSAGELRVLLEAANTTTERPR